MRRRTSPAQASPVEMSSMRRTSASPNAWMRTERVIGAGPSPLLSGEGEGRLRQPRAVAVEFVYLLCIRYIDPDPAVRAGSREFRRGSGRNSVRAASKIGNE